MSIRDHRNPYLRKQQVPRKKPETSSKRDREHNRAALVRELQYLTRVSLEV